MALPLVAPVLITAAAAATAGWYGARWWARAFGAARRSLSEDAQSEAQHDAPKSPSKVRTMLLCGVCGAYVIPEKSTDCAHPGCRMHR